MKLSQKEFARLGRWMLVCSGLVCLTIAFYWEKDVISTLLRVWSGFFGIYCIYVGVRV